jgi:hypothetical protein
VWGDGYWCTAVNKPGRKFGIELSQSIRNLSMKDVAILKPVLAQALLSFLLLFWMAKERLGAMKAGTVTESDQTKRPVWPGRAAQVSHSFENQFEMPMLFFAVVAFSMLAGAVDGTLIMLAWAYVAFRFVHALIHCTYNRIIPDRFLAYLFSNFALMAMWGKLALHVFSVPAL